MYKTFFGLTESPFRILPDPDFLYLSPQHKLARAYLEYGLTQKLGFVVLTGEIGTGKTTLIKSLLKSRAGNQCVGVCYQTPCGTEDLLELLLKEFKVQGHFHSRTTRLSAFNEFLIKAHGQGEQVVLILDQAHNLGGAALEELRLLSNLQSDKEPLLQVILVGQPNFRERLRQPSLRQLTQRVGIHFHLQPLDLEETKEYIRYRLARAGGSGIFTSSALERIFALTLGVPCRINAWCDLALVAAFAEGRKEIDQKFLKTVVAAQGGALEEPDRNATAPEESLSPGSTLRELGEQGVKATRHLAGVGPEEYSGKHLRQEVLELSARMVRLESLLQDLTGQMAPVLNKLFSQIPPEPQDLASPAPPPRTPSQEQESKNEESTTINLESIQVLPAGRSFWKIIRVVTGAGLLVSLAALVIYASLPGRIPLKENETPRTSPRTLLNSPQEQTSFPASPTHQTSLEQSKLEGVGRSIPPKVETPTTQEQRASDKAIGPETLPAVPGTKDPSLEAHVPSLQGSPRSQTPREQVALEEERRPVPAKPETLTPQEQPASDKPSGAEVLPAPQPDIHSERSMWSPSISYQVTSRDNSLSKIVATHYPNNKQVGFAAVILANPQITIENLIFHGQQLLLPKINKSNNIIILNDNLYYILYDKYNDKSQASKSVSMLKDLKIRYVVIETQQSFYKKVYRIYLGGYEDEEKLKEALTMAERK